jgi:exodeoxyribonuclease VII large subunit
MPTETEKPRGPAGNAPEFSVSELAGAIKRALEDGFGYVRLRGEISGYRGPHASGHAYFALKDDKARIDAVIWRGSLSKMRVRPEEGMEVIAHGRITSYPGKSTYQIVIEQLEPAGLGALMVLLEERKRKLAAEGLFDESRKRAIPFLPRVVGIVTSPTGSVIRDMLAGFAERFPAHVVVWPVRVQGETSAGEVAAAIRGFNALQPGGRVPRPDIIIVARGGGSLEDLWGFNEEIVVRAAAESTIPLISAVGHETDWTLIDLVADARAPTPTKAAEWAVPKYSELAEGTLKLGLRLTVALRRVIEGNRAHWRAAARGLPRREDLLALPRQRFDAIERRLGRALVANTRAHHLRHARVSSRLTPRLVEVRLERAATRLDAAARRAGEALARAAGHRRTRLERIGGRLSPIALSARLSRMGERAETLAARAARAFANATAARRRRLDGLATLAGSLSYQSVLRRGFALVRDGEGGMVRRRAGLAEGARLDIEFADGRIQATAGASPPTSTPPTGTENRRQPSEHAKRETSAPRPPQRRHRDGGQGSLF